MISLVNVTEPAVYCRFGNITEEILIVKLNFLCSEMSFLKRVVFLSSARIRNFCQYEGLKLRVKAHLFTDVNVLQLVFTSLKDAFLKKAVFLYSAGI